MNLWSDVHETATADKGKANGKTPDAKRVCEAVGYAARSRVEVGKRA